MGITRETGDSNDSTPGATRGAAAAETSTPAWWSPPWATGSDEDPDAELTDDAADPIADPGWTTTTDPGAFDDDAVLAPLEAQFGQTRSKERVRDLAEVFTHQREVDAMLNMIPDAFAELDVRFLEPACGSGNFLTEILRRKLRLVTKAGAGTQDQFEHRLLRAISSIYGIDISPENITEARSRMAHVLLEHYQNEANTIEPTNGFLNAAAFILGSNIVIGDTLNAADKIELCEWRPRRGGRFQRVWSHALVPQADRDLFWAERIQDPEPVHFSEILLEFKPATVASRRRSRSKS